MKNIWNILHCTKEFCKVPDAIIILFYLLVINGQKLCLRLSYRDKHLSACASTTKSLSCLDGFQRLIIHNNVIWVCVQAWEKRMCYWRNMTVVWFVQNCRHKVQKFSWNQTTHYLSILGNSVIRKMISQFPYYFFGIWWLDVIRLWCTVIRFPFN